MAAILNSANLNSTLLDSAILVFPLKLTHTCQDWFPPFPKKKLHSLFPLHHLHKILHSFNLINLMMAAILNSAILDSDTAILDWDPCYLLSDSLKNTLTPLWLWIKLIQSDFKLIPSHLTWWWQPSWILPSLILPSWIQPFCTKLWLKLFQSASNSFLLTKLDDGQPSWILPTWIPPSWIQPS